MSSPAMTSSAAHLCIGRGHLKLSWRTPCERCRRDAVLAVWDYWWLRRWGRLTTQFDRRRGCVRRFPDREVA